MLRKQSLNNRCHAGDQEGLGGGHSKGNNHPCFLLLLLASQQCPGSPTATVQSLATFFRSAWCRWTAVPPLRMAVSGWQGPTLQCVVLTGSPMLEAITTVKAEASSIVKPLWGQQEDNVTGALCVALPTPCGCRRLARTFCKLVMDCCLSQMTIRRTRHCCSQRGTGLCS